MVGKHLHQEPAESSDEENTNENPNQCMWKNCGAIFETQAALVQHVNTDHIQKNKKDCTCYWEDCTREEKPFKAMYMLVVHVRRHTGEKPHKCNVSFCRHELTDFYELIFVAKQNKKGVQLLRFT